MLIKSKAKAIELLNRALPNSNTIKNIDLDKEDVIYFDWLSNRYKLDLRTCDVSKSEAGGNICIGDNASVLMEHCLKYQLGFL